MNTLRYLHQGKMPERRIKGLKQRALKNLAKHAKITNDKTILIMQDYKREKLLKQVSMHGTNDLFA